MKAAWKIGAINKWALPKVKAEIWRRKWRFAWNIVPISGLCFEHPLNIWWLPYTYSLELCCIYDLYYSYVGTSIRYPLWIDDIISLEMVWDVDLTRKWSNAKGKRESKREKERERAFAGNDTEGTLRRLGRMLGSC